MGKNDFLIGVFALATMTFAACSNEDKLGEERSNGNGNTEVVEGEPTWAKFIFKLGKDSGKSRATGDEHEGTVAEKSIKNLRAYIFSESGSFEAKTDCCELGVYLSVNIGSHHNTRNCSNGLRHQEG